ncbi:hypothetical protein MKW94_004908 [Papaver nudicaule]|uniref:3'-5' exonuclease domain-containing protein n=1 Tax=Papaver nudicaule TaxID=74823 RepID=A0AA41SCL0_PAPNU|nr:hypothetical protein [Papaver nudicaule]
MVGSSIQKVQNGLADLSVSSKKGSWSDQMSSNSSTNEGSSYQGNQGIEVVDKSQNTHYTYNVYFDNEKILTTVTHTASVVDEWIAGVYTDFRSKLNKNNLVVGLDIEWKRIRETSSRNPIAVLQLCLAHRCLIFQISVCDNIPKSLSDFLSDVRINFAGAGIDGDATKLLTDHGLYVARTEELGPLAAYKLTKTVGDYRKSWLYKEGLMKLAKEVLNIELPKRRFVQLSNWENGFLSDEQIEYACLDALVSYKLAINLMSRGNPVHIDERRQGEPKKFWRNFDEPKKFDEKPTKQVVSDKANGKANGSKANGTKSKRTN